MSSGNFGNWRVYEYDATMDPHEGWSIDAVSPTQLFVILPKEGSCDHVAQQMNIDPDAFTCLPANDNSANTIEVCAKKDGKPFYQLRREKWRLT